MRRQRPCQPTCLYWIVLVSICCGGVLSPMRRAAADEPAKSDGRKALTKADIDDMMTSLSNWGRWGKDDQRGTLNLITPEKRKQAATLVSDGVTVSMAHAAIKAELDTSPAFVHRMILPKPGNEISYAGD